MTNQQQALILEMFERGYSRDQIALTLGLDRRVVLKTLSARPYLSSHALRIVALRQRGYTTHAIARDCKIADKTVERWLTKARTAGISFPERPDGTVDYERATAFRGLLGLMFTSTTSTVSTGTTPTTSPSS